MSTSESLRALRDANPRERADLVRIAAAARRRIDLDAPEGARPRRHVARIALAGSVVAAAAIAVLATTGSPGGSQNATAAVRQAAAMTAASAQQSGTALVRITHYGRLWAGRTIKWNGSDLALSGDEPRRTPRAGSSFLVVDGMIYGIDPGDGGWVQLGSPDSIDPGSGTTPAEYLATVREDVGGTTARRLTAGLHGLTTMRLAGGATAYRGTIAAGFVARETGFKEGQRIRVLPFGYVAHDEAADPAAPLGVRVVVSADGVIQNFTVSWGSWVYAVTYSELGSTAAPVAPANARPLLRDKG
jgi:hypothetical protein